MSWGTPWMTIMSLCSCSSRFHLTCRILSKPSSQRFWHESKELALLASLHICAYCWRVFFLSCIVRRTVNFFWPHSHLLLPWMTTDSQLMVAHACSDFLDCSWPGSCCPRLCLPAFQEHGSNCCYCLYVAGCNLWWCIDSVPLNQFLLNSQPTLHWTSGLLLAGLQTTVDLPCCFWCCALTEHRECGGRLASWYSHIHSGSSSCFFDSLNFSRRLIFCSLSSNRYGLGLEDYAAWSGSALLFQTNSVVSSMLGLKTVPLWEGLLPWQHKSVQHLFSSTDYASSFHYPRWIDSWCSSGFLLCQLFLAFWVLFRFYLKQYKPVFVENLPWPIRFSGDVAFWLEWSLSCMVGIADLMMRIFGLWSVLALLGFCSYLEFSCQMGDPGSERK